MANLCTTLIDDPATPSLAVLAQLPRRAPLISAFAIFAVLIYPSALADAATELPQPMRFDWVREGPGNVCGKNCREWVSANGQVTEETPQQFTDFAKSRNLLGSTVVLESSGGHVPAGIWLGREFRRLGIATTVGKTNLLPADSSGEQRATLSSHAGCESICPFILLGGVLRHVPVDTGILVHQIWPNQRLEDVMAGTYTAREWVAQQRQLGQLAHYTIEMGGDIALFELAMRIPPWEVLRPLTAEEVRRVGLNNVENVFDTAAVKLESSKLKQQPPSVFLETAAIGNLKASSWETVERAGVPILTRKYPLTMQGEQIGHFEVSFACGKKDYPVAYKETRRTTKDTAVYLVGAGLGVGNTETGAQAAPLAVGSSSRNKQDATIESSASGTVGVAFVTEWMRDGGQPFAVATVDSKKDKTSINIGNAGLSASFDQFLAKCKDLVR